jgi:hypothetical protein
MITAAEARENVDTFNEMSKKYDLNEKVVMDEIEKKSKNGETHLDVILNNIELRHDFLKYLCALGFEYDLVKLGAIETLVIKWG